MIFKCKICGGSLNVKRGQSITECEYCGVKQTLPRFFDENTKLMYDRANNYLLHNEFDKAENIYNQILFADKEDADAYWNLVLCKYGISYVKDPKTDKYVPTCNRTYYSSVFDDENYKNAIKYANEEKATIYKATARTIDDIQKGILAVSKKEKPFDIFISYKETGENGGRTRDSIVAQELYDKFTAEGYKVFFSRITLEDKIGTEYEPYIYAALASSKVMITISSSRENIESVWVKNEWSRYLSFIGKDNSKTLIPLYFDMDKDDLPDDFAHLPSYDITIDGFEQELIRGIKKLIPLPVMLLEQRKKRKKILKKIGIGAMACAIIGIIISIPWFAKIPAYNQAKQLYYDKNYPEATWAFAELGSYKDSDEMKEKCELSWRKSLATVTCDGMSNNEYGAYYISQNGSVEHFRHDPRGNEDSKLKINEHGRYVSIADGGHKSMYALHENGYVENAKENNSLTEDWTNIIQISPMFICTSIALRADGTMAYGDLYTLNNEYTYTNNPNDSWLEPISSWKNIVSFDYFIDASGARFMAAVIGVHSDGSLSGVMIDNFNKTVESIDEILSKFKNVEAVDIAIDDSDGWIYVVALTKNNTICTYGLGWCEEHEVEDVVDVAIELDRSQLPRAINTYILTANGKVTDFYRENVVVTDVIKMNDLIIKKGGSNDSPYGYIDNPYSYGYIGSYSYTGYLNRTEEKIQIYDEWIERMK